jgi:23S rRNA (cytosine1962-C5)-methyltransferase
MLDVKGRVRLKPSEDKRIRDGHVWIYDNEIQGRAGEGLEDGDLVWVEDSRGRKLGTGFLNLRSAIAVRLLTRGAKAVFDSDLLRRRISNAVGRRRRLEFDCVRLVNAEGDHLPGLIVDRYGGVAVIQMNVAGWERLAGLVVEVLEDLISPGAIVVKNPPDTGSRGGSPETGRVQKGDLGDGIVAVREGGLEIEVDVLGGQKTGFYIDQRENRREAARHAAGGHVLDCFCYSGVWSLMCAAAGALRVTGVDSSGAALRLARANALANGLEETVGFHEADVFDHLASLSRAREKFDMVILDPPSLARTRKQVGGAMRGYIHLNRVAMGLIKPGGILVTCSCSHHMTRERFLEMLRHCSTLVRRRASVLRVGGQPEDHPWLLGVPETDYLKCVTLRLE